jgi:hypothetical protein
MKASGRIEYQLRLGLFSWPKGSSPPATTMFDPSTACTESATAFTMSRYVLALTGLISRLRFGSFQTSKTCSAGAPTVRPS